MTMRLSYCILALFLAAAAALPMRKDGPWTSRQPPSYPMPDLGPQDALYNWPKVKDFTQYHRIIGRRRYEQERANKLWKLYKEHPNEPPPQWKVDQARQELKQLAEEYVKKSQETRRGELERKGLSRAKEAERVLEMEENKVAKAVERAEIQERRRIQESLNRKTNPAIKDIEGQLTESRKDQQRIQQRMHRAKDTQESLEWQLERYRREIALWEQQRKDPIQQDTEAMEPEEISKTRKEVHKLENELSEKRQRIQDDERKFREGKMTIARLKKELEEEHKKSAQARAADDPQQVTTEDKALQLPSGGDDPTRINTADETDNNHAAADPKTSIPRNTLTSIKPDSPNKGISSEGGFFQSLSDKVGSAVNSLWSNAVRAGSSALTAFETPSSGAGRARLAPLARVIS